jgi:hypothetical protein
MVLIVMIIERALLLAIRRIRGVVQSQHNGGGGLSVAGDAVVHQSAGEAREVLAVDWVLETRAGWGTGEGVGRIQGTPLHAEFEHGVMAEMLGVIGIRISCSQLRDALGQQVPQGMSNRGLVSFIMESGSEARRQAKLAVAPTYQERTKIGCQGAALTICSEGLPGDRRKTQWFWVRRAQKQTSCGYDGMDVSHLPF